MKDCRRCGEAKPLDLFPKDRRRPDGRFPYCKACHSGYQSDWAAANPDRNRARRTRENARVQAWRKAHPDEYREQTRAYLLMHRYDITPEVYDQLLDLQGGGCAICGVGPETQLHRRLHVDHDHETGAARGLLCFQHNAWMDRGLPTDDAAVLATAAAYLTMPPMVRLEAMRESA